MWTGRTRAPSSSSCMRKAGTTTQRAFPWPKSVCTGHSELHACRTCPRPWLRPQDRRSAEGLREVPKRQLHLPLDSSLLQSQLFFDRGITPLGLKAWLLNPHRKSCPHLEHFLSTSLGLAPLPSLPSQDNDWSFSWARLGWPVELNKCELRELGKAELPL